MEITTSVLLPVTEYQIEAFSMWANNKYGSYNSYLVAFKEPAIDTYIRTHILPIEMKSILRETEPYVGVKDVDFHIKRLQMYRQRILNKIKHMKNKLGKLAFPVEADQIRRDIRDALIRRRQRIGGIQLQQQRNFAAYEESIRLELQFPLQVNPPITIVQKRINKEDSEFMDGDCVICMSPHKMTDACTTNCGHQFGRVCLSKWSNIRTRCPLCRTHVTEITEFTTDDNVV